MLPIRRIHSTPSILETIFDNLIDLKTFHDFDLSIKFPIHDIIENDKEFIVEAMLAGIKKEDILIDIDDDTLTIKAERKEHNETKDLKYNRKESFTGKYQRSFTLPKNVDVDNIGASLNEGILTITIPKLEKEIEPAKKIIEIK